MPKAVRPVDRVTLEFRMPDTLAHVADPVGEDLSAATRIGRSLFLSCDETAGVDRLTPRADGVWGDHVHFNLSAHFELPAGPGGEMDIEGLAVDDGWLWVVGSHSLKREKPDAANPDGTKALRAMAVVERDPNRYFLGRLPLAESEPGVFEPRAEVDGRRPQSVDLDRSSGRLNHWLRHDPLLKPFLHLPSKENGFDVEGIAARGLRVWLGLRGPVLRGWAVVLELHMKVDGDGRLKARRLDGKKRYRMHLLESRGLGIRDLNLDGDDLVVLLGPTMASDGPAHVVRWRDAVGRTTSGLVDPEHLEHVEELPYRGQVDHPEGLGSWPEGGPDGYLVVYDSPAPARLDRTRRRVRADVVRLGKE